MTKPDLTIVDRQHPHDTRLPKKLAETNAKLLRSIAPPASNKAKLRAAARTAKRKGQVRA